MRFFLIFVLLFCSLAIFSQEKKENVFNKFLGLKKVDSIKSKKPKATFDMYRVITLEKDTTYIDTSLTIQKKYNHNYLRRDLFGLLAFSNEGQTYNTLQYSLSTFSPLPEFGFKAKHFSYIEANQVRYSSVATPVTEWYFKSVMNKGQNLDAFFSFNTSPRFNITLAYRGLRSEGNYVNQLTTSGNFRLASSYHTKDKRYFANLHFTGQDILNEENGGITNSDDFESGNSAFIERNRMNVFLNDASSFLKGKRFFIDHSYRINTKDKNNNLFIVHQLNYEYKFFEFTQPTLAPIATGLATFRFGDSYRLSNIGDQTRHNKTYNKVGLQFENKTFGKFHFFIDDYFSNYFYNQILILDKQDIPSTLTRRINSYTGQYDYAKNKWTGRFLLTRSITNHSLSNIEAKMQYQKDDETSFAFQYQTINKLPNDNFNLHQSSYVFYNWSNDFLNEKINSFTFNANTSWINIAAQYSILNDHLYFEEISTPAQKTLNQQILKPAQYGNTINYFSVKASNEFRFWKLALDNTLLYQNVDQSASILNVPKIVTRNTFYFSQSILKDALYFQTGFTFNYFTRFFANEYNPVISEFFVQNQKKIGNFPVIDFFFNAQIQRTRVYFTLEHFNSSRTGYNYYSSPNNPLNDSMIRFGLVWNFFD